MDYYVVRDRPNGWLIEYQLFMTRLAAEASLDSICGRSWSRHRNSMFVDFATWREREMIWLEHGHYVQPVWRSEPFWRQHRSRTDDHFVHVSLEDPAMLAFTESPEKGERNIQTRMKPGRYLGKYFGDVLTAKQIAFYAEWFARGVRPRVKIDGELRFAKEPDEIVRVYEEGPHSCMKGHDFVRVYGAGDLAVAYVEAPNGNIVSRALCWPERKAFGRVYPTPSGHGGLGSDEQQDLFNRLKALGWESSEQNPGVLNGAKLLALPTGRRHHYVMPYLDHGYNLHFHGDHFTLDRDGDYCGETTSGTVYATPDGREYVECRNCGEDCDEEDVVSVYTAWASHCGPYSRRSWCSDCATDYAFVCQATSRRYPITEQLYYRTANQLAPDGYVPQRCVRGFAQRLRRCARDGHYFDNTLPRHEVVVNGRKEVWGDEAFRREAFHCYYDGLNYPLSEQSATWPGFPARLDGEPINPKSRRRWGPDGERRDRYSRKPVEPTHVVNVSGPIRWADIQDGAIRAGQTVTGRTVTADLRSPIADLWTPRVAVPQLPQDVIEQLMAAAGHNAETESEGE